MTDPEIQGLAEEGQKSWEVGQLRIKSDGTPLTTYLYVGDQQITNCVGIEWALKDCGSLAEATVRLDFVPVDLTAPFGAYKPRFPTHWDLIKFRWHDWRRKRKGGAV
jgi:hypothetical protein